MSAASTARIEANRINAQSSTGPRTEEGKQVSRRNATRHGLTAQMAVVPGEDQQAYDQFCSEFFEDLKPKGMLEQQLAHSLADVQWRLKRCRAIEQVILRAEPEDTYNRNAVASFHADQVGSLNKFSLYEQRLTRNFQSTLKEFLALQAARRLREEQSLRDAAKFLKHCRDNQLPFDPARNGFVLTTLEVETWIARRAILDPDAATSCLPESHLPGSSIRRPH